MQVQISKGAKIALLFGATGRVGSQCLKMLLSSPIYKKVIVFNRRVSGVQHEKLEELIIDFDVIENYKKQIKGDDLFCCIGTSVKKAGSKEAFRLVDYNYVVKIAMIASANKVKQFLLISSQGADEYAITFYNEVKGEAEKAVKNMEFWGTHVFQPFILLGNKKEFSFFETITTNLGRSLNHIVGDWLGEFQPVEANILAMAMIQAAQGLDGGLNVYPAHHLQDIAEQREIKRIE